jgi:hypothetical protein
MRDLLLEGPTTDLPASTVNDRQALKHKLIQRYCSWWLRLPKEQKETCAVFVIETGVCTVDIAD